MTPEQINEIQVVGPTGGISYDPEPGEIHKLDVRLYYRKKDKYGIVAVIKATKDGYTISRNGEVQVVVNRIATPLTNMQAAVDGPVG